MQTVLPAVFSYWREFASRHIAWIRTFSEITASRTLPSVPQPSRAELDRLVFAPPMMTGAEYLSASVLEELWGAGDNAELEHNTLSTTDSEIPRASWVRG